MKTGGDLVLPCIRNRSHMYLRWENYDNKLRDICIFAYGVTPS